MSSEKTSIELEEANKTFADIIEIIKNIIVFVLLVIFIRSFFIAPFSIEWDSMENNYHNKEYVMVSKIGYLDFSTHFSDWTKENSNIISKTVGGILSKIPIHIGDPKRGDVVVLRPPINDTHKLYLKRIIGMPEDTIKIESWKVFIKTKDSENFIELNENYLSLTNKNQTEISHNFSWKEIIIPKGHYWVMWDNRINSLDSRTCFQSCSFPNASHFLKREHIIWKIFFSLGHFDILSRDSSGKITGLGSFSWQVKPRLFSTPSWAEYPELK